MYDWFLSVRPPLTGISKGKVDDGWLLSSKVHCRIKITPLVPGTSQRTDLLTRLKFASHSLVSFKIPSQTWETTKNISSSSDEQLTISAAVLSSLMTRGRLRCQCWPQKSSGWSLSSVSHSLYLECIIADRGWWWLLHVLLLLWAELESASASASIW